MEFNFSDTADIANPTMQKIDVILKKLEKIHKPCREDQVVTDLINNERPVFKKICMS